MRLDDHEMKISIMVSVSVLCLHHQGSSPIEGSSTLLVGRRGTLGGYRLNNNRTNRRSFGDLPPVFVVSERGRVVVLVADGDDDRRLGRLAALQKTMGVPILFMK